MEKKTIFVIIFFIISIFIYAAYIIADPVPGASRFHLPEPRDVDINGITFKISWGFIEDKNSSSNRYVEKILNYDATKEERTFHQNDILLLDIIVYDFNGTNFTYNDLNDLNDGSYENKSINGVDGIFKTESVETYSGIVKNIHLRYYFNYIKDNKLVMIQCDKLNSVNEIVN